MGEKEKNIYKHKEIKKEKMMRKQGGGEVDIHILLNQIVTFRERERKRQIERE